MSENDDHHEKHRPFHWTSEELGALALVLGILALLVIVTVAFGIGGLITAMVAATAVTFVVLTVISRG